MTAKAKAKIPKFETEAEERAFWESHDSTDYLDLSKAQPATFHNLKPSTKSISLRLPETLLDQLKSAANKRDVPYQSLIKIWLREKLDENALDRRNAIASGGQEERPPGPATR